MAGLPPTALPLPLPFVLVLVGGGLDEEELDDFDVDFDDGGADGFDLLLELFFGGLLAGTVLVCVCVWVRVAGWLCDDELLCELDAPEVDVVGAGESEPPPPSPEPEDRA